MPSMPSHLKTLHRVSSKHAAVRTEEYLYNQLIPYIGNKRKLLPLIHRALSETGAMCGTFADVFAGSGVVARMAKTLNYRVLANDWEPYSLEINRCFIGCNGTPRFEDLGGAQNVFKILNALDGEDGYVSHHLCPRDDEHPDIARERMFFTRCNGKRIDAMREQIAKWENDGLLNLSERSYLLAPMMFAVSYVSNTSGVFKGFHNGWGGQTGTALYRIRSDIKLHQPVLLDNEWENEVFRLDAQKFAETMRDDNRVLDIAYLDPPYNQHPYGSNYHVLNTVALWDKPPLSAQIERGNKSAIRLDWRTERRSSYNYAEAADAYDRLLQTLRARFVLTSYSTDGNIPLRKMLKIAAQAGTLRCVFNSYKRYRVSSQRMSSKPMNVEFVLIVEASQPDSQTSVTRIYDEIMRAEETALSQHAENAEEQQQKLF